MRLERRALAAPSVFLLLLSGAGCASSSPGPPETIERPTGLRIEVTADVRAGTLDVVVGADGAFPRRWRLGEPGLVRRLQCRVAEAWRSIDARRVIAVPAGATALRWRYAVADGASMRAGRGAAGGYTLRGNAYLGRADPLPACPLVLTFRDPGGEPLRPLLPWPVDARGTSRITTEGLWNPGVHTFGGRRHTLTVGEGRLEVAILPGRMQRTDAELLRWLKQAAEEVRLVRRGSFLHARIPVTLIPSRARGGDVIPFGSVEWSTPQSVALLVRANATVAELRGDWVGVHELMHLTHPHVRPRAAWLTEGLATYYQVIGRLRSGRRTREALWDSFRSGVRRGRRQAAGLAMGELSRTMHQSHAYSAVYWGGALLMFDLDVSLREASGGKVGLDDVLMRVLRVGSVSTVEAFGQQVDALAKRSLWREISSRHLSGAGLREGERLFLRCGVTGADAVRLGEGPSAATRRAIERPLE